MSNFLREGDLVILNKDLSDKPIMMVYDIKKEKKGKSDSPFSQLVGIECLWFTKDGALQTGIFNFKDFEKIDTATNGE